MPKDKGSKYFVPVWSGLLDLKHRDQMGNAIWTYLALLDLVVPKKGTKGLVLNGAVLTIDRLAKETGFSYRQLQRDIARLNGLYLDVKRVSHGFIIGIRNWRKINVSLISRNDDITKSRYQDIGISDTKDGISDTKDGISQEVIFPGSDSQNGQRQEGIQEGIQEESKKPTKNYPNNLWNELTIKLIKEWLESCKPIRPLKDDIEKTRAKVYESISNGIENSTIRFALDKLRQGKPLGAWGAYLLECANKGQQESPNDEIERRLKATAERDRKRMEELNYANK